MLRLDIEKAEQIVASGGVVVYPTETLWGVGGSAVVESVAAKVRRAKRIESIRPFPVLAADLDTALGVVESGVDRLAELAGAFWPGFLTLVVPVRHDLLAQVSGKGGLVGLRVALGEIPVRLARSAGGFLISTSANITGSPPPATFEGIDVGLLEEVDGYVERIDEPLVNTPSTVLAWNGKGWHLERPGAIPIERLAEVVEVDL